MNDHSTCDPRNQAYKNGKTFEECKVEARKASFFLSEEISLYSEISWNRILEISHHDEIVYKLTLKFLREMGYDIGNYNMPRVTKRIDL
jgi:hypothetical protein